MVRHPLTRALVIIGVVAALVAYGASLKPPPPQRQHATVLIAAPPLPPVPAPTDEPWQDARTTVGGCTDAAVSGTITNIGASVNTYIVSVEDDGGSFELGDGNVELTVPAGATQSWTAPVTFSNPPTAPVSCLVAAVLTN